MLNYFIFRYFGNYLHVTKKKEKLFQYPHIYWENEYLTLCESLCVHIYVYFIDKFNVCRLWWIGKSSFLPQLSQKPNGLISSLSSSPEPNRFSIIRRQKYSKRFRSRQKRRLRGKTYKRPKIGLGFYWPKVVPKFRKNDFKIKYDRKISFE